MRETAEVHTAMSLASFLSTGVKVFTHEDIEKIRAEFAKTYEPAPVHLSEAVIIETLLKMGIAYAKIDQGVVGLIPIKYWNGAKTPGYMQATSKDFNRQTSFNFSS